jgi:hypothetical protein
MGEELAKMSAGLGLGQGTSGTAGKSLGMGLIRATLASWERAK